MFWFLIFGRVLKLEIGVKEPFLFGRWRSADHIVVRGNKALHELLGIRSEEPDQRSTLQRQLGCAASSSGSERSTSRGGCE